MRLLVLALRRIAWMPPTLLGLTLIVFAVSHVIPADPARVMAGENASPAQVEAVRVRFGLDKPLPQQFVRYVTDVMSGEMGMSLSHSSTRPRESGDPGLCKALDSRFRGNERRSGN